MKNLIESTERALAEVEFFEAILDADDDILDETFDADDVARLEALADLIGACEDGVLSEDDDDLMEGLRSWLLKKKKQFVRKLPPGAKMVFGKIVKGGKVVGGAAKKAAAGVQKAVQKGVAAKRAVQGAAYRFTDAGQKARAAAKKVADTKGRKAGAASWQKSQETYKKHVKAGESHAFASSQAQKSGARAAVGGKKPQPRKAKAPAPAAPAPAPVKKKSAPRKRKTKMEDVFQEMGVIA